MKKRSLPFSLLLVIMLFGQAVIADQGGHYVPREKETTSAEAYLSSMRVNQHTGLIDPAWMIEASKKVENSAKDYASSVYWLSMGPDNIGGKTTAVLYNVDNLNEAYIGSMGGGVFYTWNLGISWHRVGENLMVSCMAQAEDGTIYVGTGDGGSSTNGLDELGYDNSFLGSGLYMIKDKVMTRIESTKPSEINGISEWCFINDVAVDGDRIVVATADGVRYSDDAGNTWSYAKVDGERLTGNALQVKVAADHNVVASVDGAVYIGKLNNMVCGSSTTSDDETDPDNAAVIYKIGLAAGLLDIAVAPSDKNVVYAATVNTSGVHESIYRSDDLGDTWRVVLPKVNGNAGHQVYDEDGLNHYGLVVDLNNPDRLYVVGNNLWGLERPTLNPDGNYIVRQLSDASSLCAGLNAMALDPKHANKGYIAADGGIYKVEFGSDGYCSFVNCNRGYVAARCLTVAPGNKTTRVVGGLLDHGPVLIEGLENTNNLGTADLLLPANSSPFYGTYSSSYEPGPCAVSMINPTAIILTTVDNGLYRSENSFVEQDISNFTNNMGVNQAVSHKGYHLPIALWESFDDDNSIDSLWYYNRDTINAVAAGTEIQCFSKSGGYPFTYTLENALAPGDSIEVRDPVTAKLYLPTKYVYKTSKANVTEFAILMTKDVLRFDVACDWHKVAKFPSSYQNTIITCMTVSGDGDVLFCATKDGKLIRLTNLNGAVDAYTASADSSDYCVDVLEMESITDQYITSIAIFKDDPNKVVVTLGNYGNDNYILYSKNALSASPTFTAKQGNLPKMPVYASVYTSTYTNGAQDGHVIIGTEHGVYRTTNINSSSPNWVYESANLGDVPVMELKQQLIKQADRDAEMIVDDDTVTVTFAGTNNQGVIYAATLGRGLFRCETYRQSETSVPEAPTVSAVKNTLNMYPNPVSGDNAKVSFELNNEASVNYQVFDMTGRQVRSEVLGNFGEGKHEVDVAVSGLSQGSYILRLNAGGHASTVKFMVF